MIFLIDLDGTICTEESTFERSLARPLPGAREALSALSAAGHTLVIYSARSWSELRVTEKWLRDNKIPYDGIHMGKPVADIFIDDRAISFKNWTDVTQQLAKTQLFGAVKPPEESTEEGLLYLLRRETKVFLEDISSRSDILDPVLEVGPMSKDGLNSSVFFRMPETFVDSRELFQRAGKKYMCIDTDSSSHPDVIGDFSNAASLFEAESIGTVVMMNFLEHMPDVWEVPRVLLKILKPSGRTFILTPWNLRFHGPRPDCWRISDDGYQALFGELFDIEALDKIECPGRALSPVGIKCVLRKKVSDGRR